MRHCRMSVIRPARLHSATQTPDDTIELVGSSEVRVGLREEGNTVSTNYLSAIQPKHPAKNRWRNIGQKRPLLPKHVWSIRVSLEMADNRRDLALFNMSVDSKLRGCDLVCMKVRDVFAAGRVKERASVTQSKAGKPLRLEITETTRQSFERVSAGSPIRRRLGRNISGPAVYTIARICRRESMRLSCATGLRRQGLSRRPMEPI